MVQPHEVIVLEHWGGIPPLAWANPVASKVKMTDIIAVTAKRLRVVFIFPLSILSIFVEAERAKVSLHHRLKQDLRGLRRKFVRSLEIGRPAWANDATPQWACQQKREHFQLVV